VVQAPLAHVLSSGNPWLHIRLFMPMPFKWLNQWSNGLCQCLSNGSNANAFQMVVHRNIYLLRMSSGAARSAHSMAALLTSAADTALSSVPATLILPTPCVSAKDVPALKRTRQRAAAEAVTPFILATLLVTIPCV